MSLSTSNRRVSVAALAGVSTRASYKGLFRLFGHKRFDDICI